LRAVRLEAVQRLSRCRTRVWVDRSPPDHANSASPLDCRRGMSRTVSAVITTGWNVFGRQLAQASVYSVRFLRPPRVTGPRTCRRPPARMTVGRNAMASPSRMSGGGDASSPVRNRTEAVRPSGRCKTPCQPAASAVTAARSRTKLGTVAGFIDRARGMVPDRRRTGPARRLPPGKAAGATKRPGRLRPARIAS